MRHSSGMLRAGLIGVSSAGKTTLFQLLTRPRGAGGQAANRQDASVGPALVPDPRLDRLAGALLAAQGGHRPR